MRFVFYGSTVRGELALLQVASAFRKVVLGPVNPSPLFATVCGLLLEHSQSAIKRGRCILEKASKVAIVLRRK
jgi:hypothetical protein